MIVVLIIINFAVITLIWNILQRLYMKITGASVMFSITLNSGRTLYSWNMNPT